MPRYQTTLNIDGADVEVGYTFSPGRPEEPPCYSHGGLPADPPEIYDVSVITIEGEKPDAVRTATWETYVQKHHMADLMEHAAQQDAGPDPDDARDQAFDDQLMHWLTDSGPGED